MGVRRFLLKAVDALLRQRYASLGRLCLFERRRIRDRSDGCRWAARAELDARAAPDFLVVSWRPLHLTGAWWRTAAPLGRRTV